MLFTFFVFDREYPFRPNLGQKVRVAGLTSNMIPTILDKVFGTE